jgi:hypothetical protein
MPRKTTPRPLPLLLPNLRHRRMRQQHIRITLHRDEVMPPKTLPFLIGPQQLLGRFQQLLRPFPCQRLLPIDRFIHRRHQSRQWPQPRKPRIIQQQPQEIRRRADRPKRFLISDPFRRDQRLVQTEQSFPQFPQPPLRALLRQLFLHRHILRHPNATRQSCGAVLLYARHDAGVG